MVNQNSSPRKNITIALSDTERKFVGDLKTKLSKKNFTQVFLYLLDFYRDNIDFITEHESDKVDILTDFKNLRELVSEMKKNQLSHSDVVSLKEFIDRIQEIKTDVGFLTKRFDEIEAVSINNDDIILINDKLAKLTVDYDTIMTKVADGQAAVEEIKEIKSLIKNMTD